MWVYHLIRLSTLSLVLTYVVCTTPQPQSQLATLHERMNQMISELYSSPLLSKAKAALSSEEPPAPSQEPTYEYAYSAAPAPQVTLGSPPSVLEPGAQSIDYAYPAITNPVPRAAWPYPYEYSYQPHFAPPIYSPPLQTSYPAAPYPEYARSPFSHIPQPAFAPTPVPSPMSYPQFAPAQFSAPPPCQPSFSFAPSFPNSLSLRAPQAPYSPISSPSLIPHPSSCPSALPYPPSQFFPPPVPQHCTPPLPYPSHLPASYRSSPYLPPFSYPQPMFQHNMTPQSFPKPAEFLPQPQYEYSS